MLLSILSNTQGTKMMSQNCDAALDYPPASKVREYQLYTLPDNTHTQSFALRFPVAAISALCDES